MSDNLANIEEFQFSAAIEGMGEAAVIGGAAQGGDARLVKPLSGDFPKKKALAAGFQRGRPAADAQTKEIMRQILKRRLEALSDPKGKKDRKFWDGILKALSQHARALPCFKSSAHDPNSHLYAHGAKFDKLNKPFEERTHNKLIATLELMAPYMEEVLRPLGLDEKAANDCDHAPRLDEVS